MDNETCDLLKKTLPQQNIPYQIFLPYIHRRNAEGRSNQTFKEQFIVVLCSTDPKYPAQEWDRLLPQATMTLNLLRTSITNSTLWNYDAIFGIHDFNWCLLVPPGTKVIVHEKTDNCWSWLPHGMDGWYISPSKKQYKCVQCFIPATSSLHNVDTLTFFTFDIPSPKMDTED